MKRLQRGSTAIAIAALTMTTAGCFHTDEIDEGYSTGDFGIDIGLPDGGEHPSGSAGEETGSSGTTGGDTDDVNDSTGSGGAADSGGSTNSQTCSPEVAASRIDEECTTSRRCPCDNMFCSGDAYAWQVQGIINGYCLAACDHNSPEYPCNHVGTDYECLWMDETGEQTVCARFGSISGQWKAKMMDHPPLENEMMTTAVQGLNVAGDMEGPINFTISLAYTTPLDLANSDKQGVALLLVALKGMSEQWMLQSIVPLDQWRSRNAIGVPQTREAAERGEGLQVTLQKMTIAGRTVDRAWLEAIGAGTEDKLTLNEVYEPASNPGSAQESTGALDITLVGFRVALDPDM